MRFAGTNFLETKMTGSVEFSKITNNFSKPINEKMIFRSSYVKNTVTRDTWIATHLDLQISYIVTEVNIYCEFDLLCSGLQADSELHIYLNSLG